MMKIAVRTCPFERRRQQYPPIGDQLDAMVRLAAHLLEQGVRLPADVRDWVDKCLAVKRRNPVKPEDNQPA